MLGISFEHILILGVILLFLGPKRLPELSHSLGKAIRNFKDSVSGVEEAKFRHLDEKNPAQAKTTADSSPPSGTSSNGDPGKPT